jgi:hypothetical protein
VRLDAQGPADGRRRALIITGQHDRLDAGGP